MIYCIQLLQGVYSIFMLGRTLNAPMKYICVYYILLLIIIVIDSTPVSVISLIFATFWPYKHMLKTTMNFTKKKNQLHE